MICHDFNTSPEITASGSMTGSRNTHSDWREIVYGFMASDMIRVLGEFK